MVRKGHSVLKKASWGTRRVFKGSQNSTCHIERVSKDPQNSTCCTECVFKDPQNSTYCTECVSEARGTADSTDCEQPPMVRDAFSKAPGA